MSDKTALIIGHQWPEPTSSAAGVRMLQLLQSLNAAGWQLTFVCAAERGERAADLRPWVHREERVQLNDDCFNEWVRDLNPGLVMYDRFMTEEQFGWRVRQECPTAINVLDTEDLHCLRRAREEAIQGGEPPNPMESELAYREVASIFRCDQSLIISEAEMRWLTEDIGVPKELLYYLPFMVDTEHWIDRPGFEQRSGFCTIGNFRHKPNKDALNVLVSEIWPRVRAMLPTATLTIYGAHASTADRSMHRPQEGILFVGEVDNAILALEKHRALLAPLRFGAGLKGKFIDAATSGTAFVTTEIGAEGMGEREDLPGVIASIGEAFASAAVELHEGAERWNALVGKGPSWMEKYFSKTRFEEAWTSSLNTLGLELDQRRRANFVGGMLRHHQHQSTKYLSKWIMEKHRNSTKNG